MVSQNVWTQSSTFITHGFMYGAVIDVLKLHLTVFYRADLLFSGV